VHERLFLGPSGNIRSSDELSKLAKALSGFPSRPDDSRDSRVKYI
jgi:hypothetical protein